jgi:hypothetical protein
MSEIELDEKTLEENQLEKKKKRIASNRKYYLKTHLPYGTIQLILMNYAK